MMIITLEEFRCLARPTPVEQWGAASAIARKVQAWARALEGEVVEMDTLDISIMNTAANELRLGTCYNPLAGGAAIGCTKILASVRKVRETLDATT